MIVSEKIKFMFVIYIILLLSQGNTLANSVNFQEVLSQKMQEKILQSPFKVLLHRNDGKKIMAYLYAKDEKSKLAENMPRGDGSPYTTIEKRGHFKIYLYDIKQGVFLPIITPIFEVFKETSFNVEGSKILVLPATEKGKSDVLLISQFLTFEGDAYEAYGFSPDNLSFKPYIFHYKEKKGNQFYGSILKDEDTNKWMAYATRQTQAIGGFQILIQNIAISKTPYEIEITDAADNS